MVDERHLTQAFPLVAPPSRLQLLGVVSGGLTLETAGEPLRLSAGDVVLLTPPMGSRARYENIRFVDVEWSTPEAASVDGPRLVGRADVHSLGGVGAMITTPSVPFARALPEALAILKAAGAPTESVRLDETWRGPTARDERIASAIAAQLEMLATKASATEVGELATLSPRQLQRVLKEFSATYGVNAGNWRDMRNRWRLQIAVVLLSVPDLSVADIAKDVGYATATALARAFAAVGYPSPLEVRATLARGW